MKKNLKLVLGLTAAVLAGILLFGGSGGSGSALRPTAGRTAAPDLRLPDLSGRTWKLSDRRGKVVLINFWATWCAPCRYETPSLVNLANEYRSKGLEVAGISLDDEDHDAVRDFARRYKVSYPVLLPGDSGVGSEIESLPTTLLLDRKGRLAKTYLGMLHEPEVRRDVERLLAER
ncbi:MAG: TlpA family protein disulfide reductase [Bryobacterales bacterium]|nr:TlpA family protein disulfide reductase [Bryobacterales bacterium]